MSGYIGNIPVPEATQTRESFTATASQTTFSTSGYTPGYLDVYMNGVHLAPADYTATNGTDVVLTTAAAADDVIDVVAWTVFNPMNLNVADINDLTATATELNYCDGVTSNIQTQIDNISTDVVSDTTPQLGGDLDTNGNDVTFGDNDKAIFGAGSDLQIYHDGNSWIKDEGDGYLAVTTNGSGIYLQKGVSETLAEFGIDGACKLRYDNANKLATTSTGIDVTGDLSLGGLSTKQVLNVQRLGMSGSTTITSTSYVNVGNSVTYTPKKSGSTLVVMHGMQVWYGSTSVGSGDAYLRFLFNGSQVWENSRLMGNFDGGNWTRFHHYATSQFSYTTTSTSAITIQTQAYITGSVPGGLNFYHNTSPANQIIIVEYS